MQLIKRAIINEIIQYLNLDDVIVLHGARQVGKTSVIFLLKDHLENQGLGALYIDLEDSRFKQLLDSGVDEFIHYLRERGAVEKGKNKAYVLLDEIQYLENPSSFLKIMADHHKDIKLIVSGSSSFAIKSKFKDSLVGRTINFEIFPLSFVEFLDFKKFSFEEKALSEKEITGKMSDELIALYKEYVLYGGYPKVVLENNLSFKDKYLQQIIDTYIKKDIKDLGNIKEIDKFNRLVEVLASQSGHLLDITELSNTCRLSKQTTGNYLFILENTYVIKLVKPYYKNVRSELFKTPKIFFYDSGLMQMLWLKQLQKEIIGSAFETAIFSDLVKYFGRDCINYWRTADKKEIDFILKLKKEVIPIEVKLSFGQFNVNSVRYFNEKYHQKKYFVVGLNDRRDTNEYIFPWQIKQIKYI